MKRIKPLIYILVILVASSITNAQTETPGPEARLLEDFKFSTQGYVKMLLDSFFNELSSDPTANGYILIQPKSEKQRSSIEKIIGGQLRVRKFDPARIEIARGPLNADSIIQFWLIPPGASPPSLAASNDKPDRPLRIVSKPPARYTELARTNQTMGTVELKISFLANGTIGDIVTVKSVPDGLTGQAINAAKLIRFEPKIENGVAVNATKILTFSFIIY